MHRAAQRVDNCEQQLEFLTKAMVRPRTRADHARDPLQDSFSKEAFSCIGW